MQMKEDKERFFAELEALDDSETETESESEVQAFWERLKKQGRPIPTQKQPSPVKRDSVIIDLITPPAVITRRSAVLETNVSPTRKRVKRSLPENENQPVKKRAKKSKDEIQLVPEKDRIFQDLVFFFVPNHTVGLAQKLRIQRTQEYGGKWTSTFDDKVTHVLVDPNIPRIEATKAFPNRFIPEDTVIILNTWFSESIRSKFLRDVSQSRFQLPPPPSPEPSPKTLPRRKSSKKKSRMQYETPGRSKEEKSPFNGEELDGIIAQVQQGGQLLLDLDPDEDNSFSATTPVSSFNATTHSTKDVSDEATTSKNKGYQCMEAHTGLSNDNPNSKTISILQEMATYYDQTGDHWRTTAYRKAVGALQKQNTLIATREQAIAIPQIGTRLADKIEEIVTTNRLRRLENAKDDPHAKLLQLFMGVYDFGYKQASQWIAQGHKSLSDLTKRVKLTPNQRIGIEHYDDFQKRIPRDEVKEHARTVQHACWLADRYIRVITGGSWRRGSPDSGDIDLIITKPDADMAQIRNTVMSKVVPSLTKSGFFKCALSASQSGSGSKWLGASCLSSSTVWRRIDLLFVPGDELGAALLYFTGNDIFNRSMRLLASRKGMRLNQHGLYKDVMRGEGRSKVTEGTLLESKDEEKIFEILGVPWRQPWERKC